MNVCASSSGCGLIDLTGERLTNEVTGGCECVCDGPDGMLAGLSRWGLRRGSMIECSSTTSSSKSRESGARAVVVRSGRQTGTRIERCDAINDKTKQVKNESRRAERSGSFCGLAFPFIIYTPASLFVLLYIHNSENVHQTALRLLCRRRRRRPLLAAPTSSITTFPSSRKVARHQPARRPRLLELLQPC